MSPIHPDLRSALDAVEIRSPTLFALRGEVRQVVAPDPVGDDEEAPGSGGPAMVAALTSALYASVYTRPTAPHVAPVADLMARRALESSLSAANSGRGTWEPGWVVCGLGQRDRVVVARDGLTVWAPAASVRVRGGPIVAGAPCRMRVAKEARNRSDGFYLALGDAEDDEAEGGDGAEPVVRYYWHLTAEAAVPFLSTATRRLNAAGVPFLLKVLVEPDAYRRADAGVLYVRPRHDRGLEGTIAGIHQEVAPGLRPDPPLFTHRLADGLGVAEHPSGLLSFGQHRCKLVATALWRSFHRGETGPEERADALASVFREQGLDPLRPHLSRIPEDDRPTDRPWRSGASLVPAPEGTGAADGPPARDVAIVDGRPWLSAAAGIGRALCRQAVWDAAGRLCNWMGRSTSGGWHEAGPAVPSSRSLDPDLYAGSAGIALFLAQLHAIDPGETIRATARAAMERSIRRLDRPPAPGPDSSSAFYMGQLGVAYAARRVGGLIGCPDLDARSYAILERVLEAGEAPRPPDVVAGDAGMIPALLELGQVPGLERCRGLAIALGEGLCRHAVAREGTCAWDPGAPTADGAAGPPLTGLSHGAAGIGLALFELHAATGREDFLRTARGAFAYEDSLFDLTRGNWPDLRPTSPSIGTESGPGFAVAWCHGAAGIALSRLRAARLDPSRCEDHLRLARRAIVTTLDAIDRVIEYPRADATLCHGLSGLIEIAQTAGRILDEPSWRRRALAAAEVLIARHAASGDWPSGAPSGGPNPSLMIGAAGIGYTLLRLHDSEPVPSVLWIGT